MSGMRVWHVYLTPRVGTVNGVLGAIAAVRDEQHELGVETEVVAVPDGGRPFPAVRDVARRIRRGDRPDVVHFHEVLRPPHRLLATTLRQSGIPYVVSPHAGLAPANLARYRVRKAAYGRLVERRFLRRAAVVCCLSPVERDDLSRYAGRGGPPTVVIPNALPEVDAPRWTPPDPNRRARLVTLCRYDVRHKGLDRLAALAARLPEVDVVVHGAADQNEPERLAALRRSAPPNLLLAPPVWGHDKDEVLRHATLFVQPSRWEGLSMALLEALGRGVPTAVSEYVSRTLDYAGRELGLVLSDDDALAARQVRAAIGDRSRLQAWSTRGLELARTELAPANVAGRLVAVYESAAARATTS